MLPRPKIPNDEPNGECNGQGRNGYLSQLRYDWTNVPNSSFYASLNHFCHKRVLANQFNYTSGGSPNRDTLYSWGWMDLREGPVILSHPNMAVAFVQNCAR